MQTSPHPDDEVLAAYAGGDPDALNDASLVAHLGACGRCRPMVDELSLLRSALAELPDLAPSRPLRLIPPVPGAAAPAARGSWLRRLTAPAMAVGAGLVLIGGIGIGASGSLGGLAAFRAVFSNVGENLQGPEAASGKEVTGSDSAFQPVPGSAATPGATAHQTRGSGSTDAGGSTARPSVQASPEISATPAPEGGEGTPHLNGRSLSEQPWLTLLIAGAGLFVVSAGLRFSLSPRAG